MDVETLIASNPVITVEVVRSLVRALFRGSLEAGDVLARGLPADGERLLSPAPLFPDARVRLAASSCLRRYGSGLLEHHAPGVWLVLRKHGVEPSVLPLLLEFDRRYPGGGSMIRALRRSPFDAADGLIRVRTRETQAQVERVLVRLGWPDAFDNLSEEVYAAALDYRGPSSESFQVLKEADLEGLLGLPPGPVRDGVCTAWIDLCRLRGRRRPVGELLRLFRTHRTFYPGACRGMLIASDEGSWADDVDWPARVKPLGSRGTGFAHARPMDDHELGSWIDAYAFGVERADDAVNADHLAEQLQALRLDTLEQAGFYLWNDEPEGTASVLVVGRGCWGDALAVCFEVDPPPEDDVTQVPAR